MTRLRTLTRPVDDPTGTLVLVPGFADRPEKFLARVDEIDPDRRWSVVIPEPRLQRDRGPYWYDVDDDGPVTAELDASVAALHDELDALVDDGAPLESIVLVGFSQGGALSLATVLDPTTDLRPRAVGIVAGYLATRAEPAIDLSLAAGLPVLFAHGEDDELVEPLRGRSAAKALQRAGAIVSWHATSGGHRFSGELLVPLRDWLAALARGDSPSAPI